MDIPASQLGGGAAVAGNLEHPGDSLTKAREDDLFPVWRAGWKVVAVLLPSVICFGSPE